MKDLESKSDAERIIALKNMINQQSLKNKQLITKNIRIKTDTEKKLRYIEEAKSFKTVEPKSREKKDKDMMLEFKSYISGDAFKRNEAKKEPGAGNAKEVETTYCGCGSKNPEHNGYCLACVQALKSRYDTLLDQLA